MSLRRVGCCRVVRRIQAVGLTACLVAPAGCQRGQYHLDLSVDGPTLIRELRYTQAAGNGQPGPPVDPAEARLLTAVYGMADPRSQPAEVVVRGTFTGPTPVDIGGAGALEHWHTPLGDAWSYIERFRGNDSPRETLAAREAAADELVDAIRDWFDAELKNSPDRARIVGFLNTDFRGDVRNLATLVWTAGAVDAMRPKYGEAGDGLFLRIGLYLVERGYLTFRDLPRLDSLNGDDQQLAFARQLLARRLDVDLTTPGWRFLADRAAVERSLNAALGQRRLPQPDGTPEAVPATNWVADRALTMLGNPLASHDGLAARLHLPHAPFVTDGQWQPDEQCVIWNCNLPLREAPVAPALPALCYARWSTPDRAFQTARFGKVVLFDRQLADYCVWSGRLTDDQQLAWDEFVAALTPGPELVAQIQRFAFPASAGQPAAAPPSVLIEALNAR